MKQYEVSWSRDLPWLKEPTVFKGVYVARSVGSAKCQFFKEMQCAEDDVAFIDIRARRLKS